MPRGCPVVVWLETPAWSGSSATTQGPFGSLPGQRGLLFGGRCTSFTPENAGPATHIFSVNNHHNNHLSPFGILTSTATQGNLLFYGSGYPQLTPLQAPSLPPESTMAEQRNEYEVLEKIGTLLIALPSRPVANMASPPTRPWLLWRHQKSASQGRRHDSLPEGDQLPQDVTKGA